MQKSKEKKVGCFCDIAIHFQDYAWLRVWGVNNVSAPSAALEYSQNDKLQTHTTVQCQGVSPDNGWSGLTKSTGILSEFEPDFLSYPSWSCKRCFLSRVSTWFSMQKGWLLVTVVQLFNKVRFVCKKSGHDKPESDRLFQWFHCASAAHNQWKHSAGLSPCIKTLCSRLGQQLFFGGLKALRPPVPPSMWHTIWPDW